MKKTSNKGFTLVELIIVIAILAIIMLIAIPNFSGIQQRMQVRADKATAAQIGKAVRIWYTEYQSDPSFKAVVDDSTVEANKATPTTHLRGVPTGANAVMVPLFNIKSIEGFVDNTLLPTSLRLQNGTADPNQMYVVGLVGSGTHEKVVVSIASGTVTKDANGNVTACTAPTCAAVKLPAPNGDGTTNLNAKSSPKYDGNYISSPTDFTVCLAYMEA